MQYCVKCIYPENHPLGITFDEDGVCSGCRVHAEKYEQINWDERKEEFSRIVEPYRNQNAFYDCVIPVSGTGDDFYVVNKVKNEFGLNPLLVTYNTHFNTKVGIRNLSRLVTELDCDHINSTVGPDTVKKISKETLNLIGDMYWHVLAGSQTFPVQVATKFEIPLVIWGCHGQMDQVGQFSHGDRVEMTKKVRKEHSLRMLDAEELEEMSNVVTTQDMLPFKYPTDEQLEKSRVRGIYLNNYFFWNSKDQCEFAIEKFGYESALQERTHNTYESIYCHNNAAIHDYLKFLKLGYGKVTDHLCRDIRLKRISREDALKIVLQYQEVKPSNLPVFLDWLKISEEELFSTIDKFRDLRAWEKSPAGAWVLKSPLTPSSDIDLSAEESFEGNRYELTGQMESESADFILSGRMYMDSHNFKATES